MKPTYDELFATVQVLSRANFEYQQTIKRLEKRISELEERLNSNSQNSSKPPSSDMKSSKEPPRKGGAKPGHNGHHRQLLPAEQVDAFHVCIQQRCPRCASDNLQQEPTEISIWQQVEIPKKVAHVTQYERQAFYCLACGHGGTAPLPDGVEYSAFGPRLKGWISTCTGQFHLSKRETARLINDCLGISLSIGSVSNVERQTTQLLQPAYEAIARAVLKGRVIHVDETSWRDSAKNHFAWVASCANATLYRIDERRNREARDKLLGSTFCRPVVSDRYKVYDDMDGLHQYCLAHFKRELVRFSERKGYDGEWGKQSVAILDKVFHQWSLYQKGAINRVQLNTHCIRLKYALKDEIIFGGWYASRASPKLRRFCLEILVIFDRLWTFLHVPSMGPTNNQAERDLRQVVLWRKKSFGTKSVRGQRFVERIKTVSVTLHRQTRSLFDYLAGLFQAVFVNQPLPSPMA
jgi:transposase